MNFVDHSTLRRGSEKHSLSYRWHFKLGIEVWDEMKNLETILLGLALCTSVLAQNWSVETTSTAKTVTRSNTHTVPLGIGGISVSGNFGQSSKCPIAPSTLADGANCKILVAFTPAALGASTRTPSVNDSSSSSLQTAQLSGNGEYPAVLSASSLPFGSQFVNTSSAVKALTFQNNQRVPLTIWGVSASGDFTQTSTCPLSPSTLGAGASCAISVTFKPTALGIRTGTLTIWDSASTSPQTASLAGTGTLSGLLSILVAPASQTLSVGTQRQFVATGTLALGRVNISNLVSWSSSAPSVAPVSSTGLAHAAAAGITTITAAAESVTGSTTLTVTVPPPQPAITTQPTGRLISSGQTATLTVVVSGTPPFSYQWYLGPSGDNSSRIGGATSSSYKTPGLRVNTSYWVQVSNSVGSANSNTATLMVAGRRHAQALLFPVLTANDPNFTDFMTNILPNLSGVSVEMQWSEIETTQGVYDFSAFDANLQPFIQAGKAVNLIVWPATEGGNNAPPWDPLLSTSSRRPGPPGSVPPPHRIWSSAEVTLGTQAILSTRRRSLKEEKSGIAACPPTPAVCRSPTRRLSWWAIKTSSRP